MCINQTLDTSLYLVHKMDARLEACAGTVGHGGHGPVERVKLTLTLWLPLPLLADVLENQITTLR